MKSKLLTGMFGGVIAGAGWLLLSAGGCTAADNSDAPMRQALWAISTDCHSCLQEVCGATAGESHPYESCTADATCSERFGEFANCYKRSRSLPSCQTEIDHLVATSTAGRELLQNCFLLDCFDEACEGTGE